MQIAYTYSGNEGDSVRVRNLADGTETIYPTGGSPLSRLDWSADGTKLVGVRWTKMNTSDDR